MNDIATQIHARLDAIAAERVSLDEEARRLRKALEALEPTTTTTTTTAAATPGLAHDLELTTDAGWRLLAQRMRDACAAKKESHALCLLDEGLRTYRLQSGDTNKT